MAKTAGFNLKVYINDVAFRAKRVEIDDTCADLEVGDSEDGEFEDHIPGRAVAKITIENATYDPDDNPFVDPYSLESRAEPSVEVFPAGDGEDSHWFPECLVTSGKQSLDVAALEPVTITLVTKGEYFMAGTF